MDPEELSALTRNGEVLICHPDMPDVPPAAVMPESVGVWLNRGWEKYQPAEPAEAPRKRTTPKKTTDTGADAAPKDKE